MSAFGSILSIARSALIAHQSAMQVTSQNVSNAETPGYTRQRPDLMAGPPVRTVAGLLGSGVLLRDVERLRDGLLDAAWRRDAAAAGGSGMRRDLLERLEGVFAEPSDDGLAAAFDAFWDAWGDLASHPTSDAARSVVVERGVQVAGTLHRFASQIGQQLQDARTRLANDAAMLTERAREVAELNVRIVAAEADGRTAADLRDARDRAIDAMAPLADVQVIERADGSVGVLVGGRTLVDGAYAKTVTVSDATGAPALLVEGDADPLRRPGGTLGALLEHAGTTLPEAMRKLDRLASQLVSAVNTVHASGWSPAGDGAGANWDPDAGPTGSRIDFFEVPVDPDTGLPNPVLVTASSIQVSALLRGNARYVAAGNVQGATGNNAVALALSALRDASTGMVPDPANPGATQSFADFYRDLVTGIALVASEATSAATAHETMAAQADARRQSVSGVSTDEELVTLMRHQQAYVAATRLVTVADEMAQSILNMV